MSPGTVLGLASVYLAALWIFSKGKGTARRGCLPFSGALANKSQLQPLQGDKGHCHSKVCSPHWAVRHFSVRTSSQEPALGGKEEKTSRLVALGAQRGQRGISACRNLQREWGTCPQLGEGWGCGGRGCKLTWPLTLEDDFLPAERYRGVPWCLFHLRHQLWPKGSGKLLLAPSCHQGEHSALATRVHPCFPLHPASHCSQKCHTSENGASGNHTCHSLRQDGENSERNKWGQHADRSGVGMTLLRGGW